MSAFESLETKLDDIFVKNGPALPANAKKIIVEYLPYINLVLGALALLAAWGLYNAAHTVNRVIDYYNDNLGSLHGAQTVSHLGVAVWLAIIVLAIEAVLYIAAYSGTKERKKSGWDLLFYALLINVIYGLVAVFTHYGGFGRLVGSLIGSAIGFYFLFQIRASYLAKPAAKKSAKK